MGYRPRGLGSMSIDKKLKILKKVLGQSYSKSNEHLFFCPKCNHHKKKLSVNVRKNVFKCWVCDWSGKNIYRIIRNYGDVNSRYDWRSLTEETEIENFHDKLFSEVEVPETKNNLSLPNEFVSLVNKQLPKTSVYALNYLYSRGISKQDITKWKIGYCTTGKYASRVVVPSFDCDGDLNFFVTRSYDNSWRKYLNPPADKDIVFNHLYLDFNKGMILVEGVFDAIIAGENSVPLLGSTLTERSKLFHEIVKNDTPIYLALDPDAKKKAQKIIKLLLKYDVEVYDVNVHPYADVGEMSKEEFLSRKHSAEVLTVDDYLLNRIKGI